LNSTKLSKNSIQVGLNWICRNPTLVKCRGEAQHLEKVGDLESSRTPECSELNNKAQNTSHWGVLSVIGKVLKCRYRKWPRIGHLDICKPSYGQKKVRESNCQFDSRSLKVRNRPLPNIRFQSATWSWKDLDEGYNFSLDLVAIGPCSRELWLFKVPGVPSGQFRDSISGVPKICAIWMQPPRRAAENTIWGKVVASPESGLWWVLCVQVPVACPNTQGCPEC
jgi:hypothetical protein